MNFSCLESAEVSGLEASFLEEEVGFLCLFSSKGDKAPGPNDFTLTFR